MDAEKSMVKETELRRGENSIYSSRNNQKRQSCKLSIRLSSPSKTDLVFYEVCQLDEPSPQITLSPFFSCHSTSAFASQSTVYKDFTIERRPKKFNQTVATG